MGRKNRRFLTERVIEAAEASLEAKEYVRPLDVFRRIGWLYPGAEEDWQVGRVDSIEAAMQSSPQRVSEAMTLLRAWATGKRLLASEAQYVARTPGREPLRFTRSGDAESERAYRTHWISPTPPKKQRERIEEKINRAPEVVVILPLNKDWKCHRCGEGQSDFLMMEKPGPACLCCVGLGDLDFLPSGDALLTRRAKAKSARRAVVVRFSRNRKRYERQGLLVEPRALEEARRELDRERS
jgi:hypothetical protein